MTFLLMIFYKSLIVCFSRSMCSTSTICYSRADGWSPFDTSFFVSFLMSYPFHVPLSSILISFVNDLKNSSQIVRSLSWFVSRILRSSCKINFSNILSLIISATLVPIFSIMIFVFWPTRSRSYSVQILQGLYLSIILRTRSHNTPFHVDKRIPRLRQRQLLVVTQIEINHWEK